MNEIHFFKHCIKRTHRMQLIECAINLIKCTKLIALCIVWNARTEHRKIYFIPRSPIGLEKAGNFPSGICCITLIKKKKCSVMSVTGPKFPCTQVFSLSIRENFCSYNFGECTNFEQNLTIHRYEKKHAEFRKSYLYKNIKKRFQVECKTVKFYKKLLPC